MHIVITGYYKKDNLGDDLFETIAHNIFSSNKKIKKNIKSYKTIPIEKICLLENRLDCDRVILFGGETLNDYFLHKLLALKQMKPEIIFNAIGISCNQPYETLINKIQIFESVIFRCKKDFEFFSKYIKCEYCPDIVFSMSKQITLYKQNIVGFFLAQPLLYKLNINQQNNYINFIIDVIKYWINKNYKIYLFAMCTNGQRDEDDNFINQRVLSKLNDIDKTYIKAYSNNKKILEKINKIKFAICSRYHSHILCIINNIPFLSLSDTPKVIALNEENDLNDYYIKPTNYIDRINYLIINYNMIRDKLKTIYKKNNSLTKKYYDESIYFSNRNENIFYIDKNILDTVYNKLVIFYNQHKTNDDWFNTQIIIFFLTGTLENDYIYGLNEKIHKPIEELKNDMYWLMDDCINKKNLMFYEKVSHIIGKTFNLYGDINIKFIDQNDYKGLHRSGWQYVVDNLDKFHGSKGMLCDLYLDRTFHWNSNEYTKLDLIPYKQNWVGFIHHTCDIEYSSYNTINLFKNRLFIESLKYCKGLITLSDDLKSKIEKILYDKKILLKVYSLKHPTEIPPDDKIFTLKKFIMNTDKKIIQIGAWMRVIGAVNKLDLGENNLFLTKYVLKGKKMENYYYDDELDDDELDDDELDDNKVMVLDNNKVITINDISIIGETTFEKNNNINMCRDNTQKKTKLKNDVQILSYLNNNDYDELLNQNIVFINLVDASAVNTVIECVVRNTPIIVNKLPALVEILGEKYPLFYDNVDEVKFLLDMTHLENGYNYLKKLNKNELKIGTFINKFELILEDIKLNTNESDI
jgi:hypothetical protein